MSALRFRHKIIDPHPPGAFHDICLVGDIAGNGEAELVVLSQKSRILAYYDIPPKPRVSPWPCQCCQIVAENFDAEGLVVVDIDGDGVNEIVPGTTIFRPPSQKGQRWKREAFAEGFVKTRVAVSNLNQDGRLEIVLAEGESHPARLAWLSGVEWEPVMLRNDLFHPHSLAVADFNGDGLPDIVGKPYGESIRVDVWLNDTDGGT